MADIETSQDLLAGRDQIMAYIQRRDWKAVVVLIQEKGFPAAKICGRWEASKACVDRWHQSQF